MAKARLLRPDFWTDERVVSVSPLARLLFQGLWTYVCDNGHVDDSTLQLKMRVLPGDSCDVTELLDQLLKTGMVIRENGYLKVVNLSKQQPLDLRFLIFCDHCANDPARRYHAEDKKGHRRAPQENTSAPRVRHASGTRAPDVDTTSAQRSGDGDGDGDGDGGGGGGARKRGTRIPAAFTITDEMRVWAAENAPYANVDRATERFIDHWSSATKNATKLDWTRTWRNWLRKDSDDTPEWKRQAAVPTPAPRHTTGPRPPYPGDPDDLEAYRAFVAEWE